MEIINYELTVADAEWCYDRIVEAGAPDWMRARARAVIREIRWDELRKRHQARIGVSPASSSATRAT